MDAVVVKSLKLAVILEDGAIIIEFTLENAFKYV